MIVVDANVVAYLIIAGDFTEAARAVYRADPDWHLPVLWRHEYLNILATTARFGKTPREGIEAAWDEALARFASAEHEVEPKAVLVVSLRHQLSAYDAQYAVLADQLDVPLVTNDRGLRTAYPERAVSMQGFCDGRDG